jgi:hypothetical protein
MKFELFADGIANISIAAGVVRIDSCRTNCPPLGAVRISDGCDHRQFRIGRVRCRKQMLARHHEPENLRASEQRRSRKQEKDIAKYFVPASTIRAFIPTEYRF